MPNLNELVRSYQKKAREEKLKLLKLERPKNLMLQFLVEFQQPTKQRRLSAKTLARLITHFERSWGRIEQFFDEVEGLHMSLEHWGALREEAQKMPEEAKRGWKKAFDEAAALRADVMAQTADLVPRVRVSVAGHRSDAEDLDGVGFIGLIKAMENFDAERGVPFDVYARSWIYNSMIQYLRRDKLVNPSEKVLRSFRLYDKTFTKLQGELGREPEEEEVAAAMQISAEDLQNLLEIDTSTTSLDLPVGKDEDYSLHEVLGEDEAAPYEQMEGKMLARKLQEHMKKLDDSELSIVMLRWYPIQQSSLEGKPMPIDQAIIKMQEIAMNRLLAVTSGNN
ncbi:MAG: sigma-70 family RNA polymerase sigma factor [bacterium]